MAFLILRSSAAVGGGGGDWADTFVTSSGLSAALATDGAVIGIRGTNTSQYGGRVTAGNGGSLTFMDGGAFDGDDCIRLVPPDTLVGENAQYCSILDGIDITNGGVHAIDQINIAFLMRMGSRYIDLAPAPKWLSFQVATAPNGAPANRAAIFEGYFTQSPIAANPGRIYGVTADETQHYFNPYETGCYAADCGPASAYIVVARGTANHAASPPVIGPNEWVHVEMELDVRQNRGNADGRNKLTIRTADGVINRTLSIPLNHEATWNFAWDCIIGIEGLGWYWNTAGTAHADNWIEFSHVRLSANRAVDSSIGPPTGYLD
jgi:hypothetical protein